jgi:hypothetical protein
MECFILSKNIQKNFSIYNFRNIAYSIFGFSAPPVLFIRGKLPLV